MQQQFAPIMQTLNVYCASMVIYYKCERSSKRNAFFQKGSLIFFYFIFHSKSIVCIIRWKACTYRNKALKQSSHYDITEEINPSAQLVSMEILGLGDPWENSKDLMAKDCS
jgi:hypothetical protein